MDQEEIKMLGILLIGILLVIFIALVIALTPSRKKARIRIRGREREGWHVSVGFDCLVGSKLN